MRNSTKTHKDKPARATTIDIGWAQVLLAAVIAIFSGSWAWATHNGDQRRINEQQARDERRIQEQQARDERQAQNEAIAQMSRQLGLMQAQCDEEQLLRSLLDRGPVTRRKEQCYDGFIGARSLVFISKERISPDSSVSRREWDILWDSLEIDLIHAGAQGYYPNVLSTRWEAIVRNSKGSISQDGRQAQNEAITKIQRQLALLRAQCEKQDLLHYLLESVTQRKEQCYMGYIEARSLVLRSRGRIVPDPTVSGPQWNAMWDSLEIDLIQAGAQGYHPYVLSKRWKMIVDNSKKTGS